MKLDTDIPPPKRIAYLLIIWVFAALVFSYPFLFPSSDFAPEDIAQRQVVETDMPDFKSIQDIKARKIAFFNYLMPIIRHQNKLILEKRAFLFTIEENINQQKPLTTKQLKRLGELLKEYRVDANTKLVSQLTSLLKKIDIIPPELVLMQAANESAWGTSRFATKGYNFFGLWCFKRGCGFVPKNRDDGANHEVAKFKNLSHGMYVYFRNLNRHAAYSELRNIRHNLRKSGQNIRAEALAKGLGSYSERGDEYINELIQMIKFNRKFMRV